MKRAIILSFAVLGIFCVTISAQTINIWRGGEGRAKWSDAYKWKLRHPPRGNEAVHFRQDNSIIEVDQTVDLNNSMLLYGHDLTLLGNGNINFWNPVASMSTIYIPASASGYASLTVGGNLSIKGRVALAAKAFGTSAAKGILTLKDRATITGALSIGNDGTGTGQVFIRDNAIYRITDLDLQTVASRGGSAEIHILGGTAHFRSGTNPLSIILADASRKIILGADGTLRIDSQLAFQRTKALLIRMVQKHQLIAAPGSRISAIEFYKGTLIVKGELTDPGAHQPIKEVISMIKAAKLIEEPQAVEQAQATTKTGNGKSGAPAGYLLLFGLLLFLLAPEKEGAEESAAA